MSAPAPAADTPHTWAIGDIEPVLVDLRGTIGLLSHMKDSPHTVSDVELVQVRDRLSDLHGELERQWQLAWDESIADKQRYDAALAAAKAEKAAPGSMADAEIAASYWRMLRAAAQVTMEACDKRRSKPRKAAAKPKRRGK